MKKTKSCNPRVTFRVIDPATGTAVDAAEWLVKPEDIRKTAEWIQFDVEDLDISFQLHKSNAPGGDMTFAAAQKAAAKVCDGGRCGTRFEWLLITFAREQADINLDGLLAAIGGDNLYRWVWTEDAFQSYATSAWYCSGTNGYLDTGNARLYSNASRVLRAL